MPRKYVRKPKRQTRRGNAFNNLGFVRVKSLSLSISRSEVLRGGEYAVVRTVFSSWMVPAAVTYVLPGGLQMFVDWVGAVCTNAEAVGVGPTLRFGDQYNHGRFVAPTLSVLTDSNTREQWRVAHFEGLSPATSLVAEITSQVVALQMEGYFYFVGVVMEL